MPIYKALDENGWSITSVIAKDKEAAQKEIERQLQLNPSRIPYYKRWVAAGRPVEEKEI